MSSGPTIEIGVSCIESSAPAQDERIIEQAVSNSNEEDKFEFRFEFSGDGLALRSAVFENGGPPEFRFDASPKVPTITEQDVATIFRLVSEGKRPGFFYTGLPLHNPLQESRLYMLYDPQWLRWTSVGKLLADVDWLMKCLHVGAKSNDDKTVFEAWKNTSQLIGLATRVDFPKDGSGPTIMSCESASVQKNDNEITFPEEPKMKITDGCSSLYTKYATEIYQSVAYYDEPKFLKMQEIIKLILAVEWLYNEMGVRVSEEWMMKHTAKPTESAKAIEAGDSTSLSMRPPYKMVPKPTVFKRPSSDVTVKTWEAEMHNCLRKDHGVGRRYGYYDFGDAEAIMFKEDGTPCPPQKCLKLGYECQVHIMDGFLALPKLTEWCYVLLKDQTPTAAMAKFRETLLKELPQSSSREIATPMPISIDMKVEDSTNDSGVEIRVKETLRPCAPLALPPVTRTMVVKATVDNYNMLYSGEDPNEPIRPEIPGVCEAIIPDVNSWDEFISEMTVPTPRIWQAPYVGIGEPSEMGGVTTSSFPVKETPLRSRAEEKDRVFEEEGVYRGYGTQIGVRAKRLRAQILGSIRLLDRFLEEFSRVARKFSQKWATEKGPCPPIDFIYEVKNDNLKRRWTAYGKTVNEEGVEEYYHGTMLACDITRSCQLCNKGECGICGISSDGLDAKCISRESFQRFGSGFYLAPNSSKCHDYTRTSNGYVHKAMLLCDVHPGRKYHLQTNRRHLSGPPAGYDSVFGQVGEKLNYPELVVYKADAVMPRYIIVYRG